MTRKKGAEPSWVSAEPSAAPVAERGKGLCGGGLQIASLWPLKLYSRASEACALRNFKTLACTGRWGGAGSAGGAGKWAPSPVPQRPLSSVKSKFVEISCWPMIKDLSKLSFLYCYTDEVSDYHEDGLKVTQHWRSVIALSVGLRYGKILLSFTTQFLCQEFQDFLQICKVHHGNTGLDEAQAGSKIAGRNINNLRYADDTTLMAECEELKSLLMKVKEESENVGLKLNIQKS
ncbi:uncharacterized protein [Muntiacus reevesi]|uniref:uncharacterized protein n=1 Tax=Muntiacus reevesi TaxID=9886 RepID=UPI003306BD2B